MKNILYYTLGVITVLSINATFETDLTCHYIQVERPVLMIEHPNTDGMTKRIVNEIYIDRIFRAVISNEVVCATNEVDTGSAVIKTVPVDERRFH